VLFRAGRGFFHGYLWQGRPIESAGSLQVAIVWVILWGLLLRWLLGLVVRAGLGRDITALVAAVPQARLVDPLLADFDAAATATAGFLAAGERLGREAEGLAAALAEPSASLGHLRGAP
jgi:hypothetical protein